MSRDRLSELISLANRLGAPEREWAILGEGNVSTRADGESFWVTGSGSSLRTIDAGQFVRVRFDAILEMLQGGIIPDEETRDRLAAARVDPDCGVVPSTETLMHAILLGVDGVEFIGHVHPVSVNSVVCSRVFEDAFTGRLFPDEIVMCGPAPVLVPYIDPGVPLAREIGAAVESFIDRQRELPRVIHLKNHGIIALGSSARDVENILLMADKAARILVGTYALGGPSFLSEEAVERIHVRLDEDHRKRVIEEANRG